MSFVESLPLWMFTTLLVMMMFGFPVAFTLGGTALIFGLIGSAHGAFYLDDFSFIPSRIFGIVQNMTLIAVPLFIFMGITLEKSGLAQELLESMQYLFRKIKGGLAISVVLVGTLLAASTGIVGATVVTMGTMALPTMLKWNYKKEISCGTIAAAGTLGQIIPPSIVLVLLGDMMNIDVGDLFIGALIPGLLLVVSYIAYIYIRHHIQPNQTSKDNPIDSTQESKVYQQLLKSLLPPALLMIIVLGSILFGIASPTEASACGAIGALLITAIKGKLNYEVLKASLSQTTTMTSMVFTILIGAQFFGIVFRGLNGDDVVASFITDSGIHRTYILFFVMLLMFIMGFFLDFIEICFIMIPITAPLLINVLGFDPLWLAILIAINLQTSFLTPPFGFALFYLKGAAPKEVRTSHIYKGAIPFVLIQISIMILLAFVPDLAVWLPNLVFKSS